MDYWDENGPHWREFTDIDRLHGELIARDLERRAHERSAHFRSAHNRSWLDGVTDWLSGTQASECNDPAVCGYNRYLEWDEVERERQAEESWWARRRRHHEDRRTLAHMTRGSWWERWFGRSDTRYDGESGSSDAPDGW